MESILVTPENLRRAANEVDDLADSYKRQYDEFYTQVAELVSSDWKGKDANAFQAKVEEFKDDFMKMKDLMNQYATHLRTAASDYEQNQSELMSQISGLQS